MASTPLIDYVGNLVLRRCVVPDDLASVTSTAIEPANDAAAQVWERVEALYRTGMHPGIQICIRHDGEVVIDRAIGHARGNVPSRATRARMPMETTTPINLFSAAKAVTAMAMHKLEEKELLALDDPVSEHFGEFDRHGKGDVTIRQVLSHKAGMPSMPPEAFDLDLLTDQDLVEEMICDMELTGDPGGPPSYHAVAGGFVLDAVARRVAGSGLRDVLETEVRQPLGLDWFTYGVDPDHVDLVAHNVETGLRLDPALGFMTRRVLGTTWSHVLELSNDPRFLSGVIPSGNVIVTASDVAAFYQCLLNGGALNGTQVFASETVASALEPQDDGSPLDRRLGMPMRYSTGFMLGSEQISLYGWNHPNAFGHVGLSNLFTWADPDRDLVVALLTTGKPVLGTHVVALPNVISTIHEVFPET